MTITREELNALWEQRDQDAPPLFLLETVLTSQPFLDFLKRAAPEDSSIDDLAAYAACFCGAFKLGFDFSEQRHMEQMVK